MNTRTCLTVAAYLLWRCLQVLAVIPASMLGIAWLALALSGQAPTHRTLTQLYDYAQTYVRPAAPGHVLAAGCPGGQRLAPVAPDDRPAPLPACPPSADRQVTIEEAIARDTKSLECFYLILVLVSFLGLVLLKRPRRCLPDPDTTAAPAVLATS